MIIPQLGFRETITWTGWVLFALAGIIVFLPLLASTGLFSGSTSTGEFFLPFKLVANTLRISVIAGVVCIVAALVLAILLVQVQGSPWTHLDKAILLIGFTPTVLRSFGWLGVWQFVAFFGNNPLLARGSLFKVTLGLVHLYVPFVAFLIIQLIRRFDPAQIKAAMACGVRPWKISLFVILPQLARTLFGILILLIVLYTGAIITPIMLGSGHETMLVEEIYRIMNVELDPYRASNIIVVLLAIVAPASFAVVWLTKRIGHEEY